MQQTTPLKSRSTSSTSFARLRRTRACLTRLGGQVLQKNTRVPTKVTLSADSLFDFDKSTVKPSGRAELDQLATGLKGLQYDVINVTGHTDRLGPQAYNLKLSTRRAEAVSAYLVESAGIPAQKISARGVNGADPVTRPDECKGAKATPALIACLQPDRRVEIEVTGQR